MTELLVVVAVICGAAEAPDRGTASAGGPTSRPARMDEPWVLRIARRAPDQMFLLGVDLEGLEAQAAFDNAARRWRVEFRLRNRRVFEVVVDDDTDTILGQRFWEGGHPAPSPGEAMAAVAQYPAIQPYTRRWTVVLVPRFDPALARWSVTLVDRDGPIGVAWVYRGQVVDSDGPWKPFTGDWLSRLWRALRPDLGPRAVLYLLALLFLLVTIDLRWVVSLRTLDLLAVVLLLPAALLVRPMPAAGYGALGVLTVYLFGRCLARGFGPPGPMAPEAAPWGKQVGTTALGLALAAVLVLQAAGLPRADTGDADAGGLIGGQQFFETGRMPYGTISRDFATYGPFHYILYGAAERLFPANVHWPGYDLEKKDPPLADTGGRAVVFLFHLLTVAALIGVGRKHLGSVRLGLLLALAYALLPQTFDKVAHGSRLIPGAYFVLALWAWPNPFLSALALGLAIAQWWFPAALLPLWLVSFRGRDRLKFALVILGLGAVFLFLTLRPAEGESAARRWATLRDVTLLCQERFAGHLKYHPTDGIWRQLNEANLVWGHVRVGVLVAYLVFCGALLVVPRRKDAGRLAALTAAVVVGTQIWKNLHSGEYVGWYAPVLLVTLFGFAGRSSAIRRREAGQEKWIVDSG